MATSGFAQGGVLRSPSGDLVIVWKSKKDHDKARSLFEAGVHESNPLLIYRHIACQVASGTPAVITDRGFITHDIMVTSGPRAGCEGNIPVEFYTSANEVKRPPVTHQKSSKVNERQKPSVSNTQDEFSGQVMKVIDGDTLEVMRLGKRVTVELFAIDCPEPDQAFGHDATAFTTEKALNQIVTVTVYQTAANGHLVGTVHLPYPVAILNDELLRHGLAWWAPQSKQDSRKRFQSIAKKKKIGLWQNPHAMPPWTFRNKG